jgi:predicted acylesterase/phospholipase RssA
LDLAQNDMKAGRRSLVVAILLLLVSACATLPRDPVPLDDTFAAEVPGMPDVRAWGGEISPAFQADIVESVSQEAAAGITDASSEVSEHAALAISGGGSDGAFGAGFLNGWSAAGDRPDFKLVTGISTGALIAPFAFLGSDYDEELKEVYTTINTESILDRLSVFSILFRSESLAKTDPLKGLVAEHMDADLLRAIADRHNLGYRLYIGTTNMDAQRLSVWNMGAIANYGTPEALQLFRDVMVASASIPVAFPPVMIEVEVDENRFDEMHTDGGTVTQVFFYSGVVDLKAAAREVGISSFGNSALYIIRNGHLSAELRQVERKLSDISERSVSTMIKSAAGNNLYRIYAFTRREGVAFRYVDIPDEFVSEATELFDQDEMKRLYDVGYQLGRSGDGWRDEPPGFHVDDGEF